MTTPLSTSKLIEIEQQAKRKTKDFADSVNHGQSSSEINEFYEKEILELHKQQLKQIAQSATALTEMKTSFQKQLTKLQVEHDARIERDRKAQITVVEAYEQKCKTLKFRIVDLGGEV